MTDILVSYVLGVFQMFLIMLFASLILAPNSRFGRLRYVVVLAAPVPILFVNFFSIPWLNLTTSIACACLLVMLIYTGKIIYRIVVAILGMVIFAICDTVMGSAVVSILSITDASLSRPAVSTAVSAIGMLFFLLLIMTVRFAMAMQKRSGGEHFPVANFSTLGLLVVTILVATYIGYSENLGKPGEFLSGLGVVVLFCMILIDLAIIISNESDLKRARLQTELSSMQRQEKNMAELIDMQNKNLKRLGAITHDYINHIHLLNGLLDKQSLSVQDKKKTEEYINDLLQSAELTPSFKLIENSALRVILDRYQTSCLDKSIGFHTDIHYSSFDFVAYKDICVLFMNALDNAIEACQGMAPYEENRYVSLSIHCHNKMVLIRINNAKGNKINEQNDELLTTKEDVVAHGIGVKNMRRIASLYDGDLFYRYSETQFELLISLTMPSSSAK